MGNEIKIVVMYGERREAGHLYLDNVSRLNSRFAKRPTVWGNDVMLTF